MVKLSIVIPTYNRKKYVLENVKSLVGQIRRNKEEVELMVCDNASQDGTEHTIAPLLAENPFITYVRHKENIGAHANFYYGIEHVNGEYVVLLGDDDLLSPYYCDTVLQLLSDYPADIVNYNYLQINNDNTKLKIYDSDNYGKGIRVYDGKTFIQTFWNKPSFMTSNIFKRELMLKGMKECYHADCYGYDWFLCMLYGIKDSSCAIHYDYPLAIQSVADNRTVPAWSLYAIVGIGNVYRYLDASIPGVWQNWKRYTRSDYDSFLYKICSANAGRKMAKEHETEYAAHFMSFGEKTLFKLSLHTNRVVMKIIKLIIKCI